MCKHIILSISINLIIYHYRHIKINSQLCSDTARLCLMCLIKHKLFIDHVIRTMALDTHYFL